MANLTFISPFFIVSDVNDSVAFYVDKLGFEVIYIGPEGDPFYAMVGRDHVSIMLKAIANDIKPVPIIPGTNGPVGTRIFLLRIRMLYLRNIVRWA